MHDTITTPASADHLPVLWDIWWHCNANCLE